MPDVSLRIPTSDDVDALYPMLIDTTVTDTIVWDGPDDFDSYRERVLESAEKTRRGELHLFTIVADGEAAGMMDVRPYEDEDGVGDMGLWIGEPFHGRGVGTAAVSLLVEYGHETVGLRRIEAKVFVGNTASRRIFEKNGFEFVELLPAAVVKRGVPTDEWLFARILPTS